MRSFLVAVAFLTVIPIRFREPLDDGTIARSRFWYPVVGLLLGGILGGWTCLLVQFAPHGVAAFLVLLAWVGITGALHIDGFCDLCDGLFGGHTPEERLRIMKDPHLGTFGLVGGVLLLLGKYVAIYELLRSSLDFLAPAAVALAVLVSRCMVLTVAARANYPREEGTGKAIIRETRNLEAVGFALFAAAVTIAFRFCLPLPKTGDGYPIRYYLFPTVEHLLRGSYVFVAVWAAIVWLRKCCEKRLNGITGDCLGAAIELGEVILLLAVVLLGGIQDYVR